VEIDLTSVRRTEDEARRQLVLRNGEPESIDGTRQRGDTVQLHDEVEIIVLAVLGTEERVDAPAAVEPDLKARTFDGRYNFEHVIGGHHNADLGKPTSRWVPSPHHELPLGRGRAVPRAARCPTITHRQLSRVRIASPRG
jgi:hypothetical protein